MYCFRLGQVIDQSAEKRRICAELEADKQTLTAKISKKQEDLERQEKRLKSLTQVRPAFMEEYEVLEQELKVVYETYIERFRNLSYLESELAQQQQMENEKLEESNRALKKLQKKYPNQI
jgi:clusterin-associated protein 1